MQVKMWVTVSGINYSTYSNINIIIHKDVDLFVNQSQGTDFWNKIYCPEDAYAIFGIKTDKDIDDGGIFFSVCETKLLLDKWSE